MLTSKLTPGAGPSERSGDSSASVVLRDGGELRHHTWRWLSQLRLRDAINPIFPPGLTSSLHAHRVAWRMFWNKLRAFRCFAKVESARRGRPRSLEALAARLSNEPTFANLCRTEGLGYYAAMTALRHDADLSDWLGGDDRLPSNCLIPFHLGVGMAVSLKTLSAAASETDDSQLRRTLAELSALCRRSARPGFGGLVFEPLGFIAVNYYRSSILQIDELLSGIEPGLSGYFWHGVGRGLYFCPESFLPYRNLGWHALEAARRLAADERKLAVCQAGLSFASTLINIHDPRRLDFFLAWCDKDTDDDAIASGVSAAMVVWSCWSQADKHTDEFRNFQPRAASEARWRRLAAEPSRLSVKEVHPTITRSGRFEELFRYRHGLPH